MVYISEETPKDLLGNSTGVEGGPTDPQPMGEGKETKEGSLDLLYSQC